MSVRDRDGMIVRAPDKIAGVQLVIDDLITAIIFLSNARNWSCVPHRFTVFADPLAASVSSRMARADGAQWGRIWTAAELLAGRC